MDDIQWNKLIRDVADNFNEVTISRGFQYYKQKRVSDIILRAPRSIEAIVHGNEHYDVEINLDLVSMSQCTCPVNSCCKHIVAVLMLYASLENRSVHAIVNAQSIIAPKKSNRVIPFPSRKSVRMDSTIELVERIPAMNVLEWHDWFEQCVSHVPQDMRSSQYAELLPELILQHKNELPEHIAYIYMLNVHFFVLAKLISKRLHHTDYY